MIRPDFSYSKTELARRCAYWLRSDVAWDADEDNEFARGGRKAHHWMACDVNGSSCEPLETPELRAMVAQARAWLDSPAPGKSTPRRTVGMRAEVAFAFDRETGEGRELVDPPGETDPRWYANEEKRAKYGVRPSEICGRVDLCCFGVDEQGSFASVWDYKFHFGPRFLDAKAQLEVCALAVARAWGVDRVKAVGVHVWTDGRPVYEEPYELDEFDLFDIATGLDAIDAAANDAAPNPGPHCTERYCPARLSCPTAKKAVTTALSVVPAERLVRGRYSLDADPMTNDEGAWALVAIELAEDVLKARKKAVRALADKLGGIVRSDGKVYAMELQARESPNLEADGAIAALEAMGLGRAIKTEVSTTWTAIKEEGGPDGLKRAKEALRLLEAVKVSQVPIYDARVPKPADKALTTRRAS